MNFEDYDETQGRKLGPMEWACNCQAPVLPRREQIFTKMYRTQADSGGVCVLCGHYALKMESYLLDAEKQRRRA